MRVGVACERLPGREGATALETLECAAELGFDGVAFPAPRAVSSTLNLAELDAVREKATELGLFLEVGVGRIADASGSEDPIELAVRFGAAVRAGSTEITGYTALDRFARARDFAAQLATVVVAMRRLADLAAQHGVHVSLESHEDLSSYDVLEVLGLVDSPAVGVNLDLPNVVVRGEDPHEATARLAPYVRQTQLEDVTFALVDDGLHRRLAACGAGIIDWARVVGILRERSECQTLCIEQHRGQFGLRVFDGDWVRGHPQLPAEEPLWLVGQTLRNDPTFYEYDDVAKPRSEDKLSADLIESLRHLRGLDALESTQCSRYRSDPDPREEKTRQ